MSDEALSLLCRACGLCCDGHLFSHVALEPGDEQKLEAHGLTTVPSARGVPVLPQRCAALHGLDCRVYRDRPAHCARFLCLLAVALREDEVSLDDARAVVNQAQRLILRGQAGDFLRQHFLGRHGAH